MNGFGNVLIIGDSYSTFKGYNPEGYSYWYPKEEADSVATDVTDVTETWWHMLINETESTLVLNDSYSGSTVCSTERQHMPGTHFNIRVDRMIKDGFFEDNRIDTVFVFGGTNDSWIDSPIGNIKYGNITDEDIKDVLPAFSALIAKLIDATQGSKIIALINSELKEEIACGFEEICFHYGITYVRFEKLDKLSGHPNKKGMAEIKNSLLKLIKE